MLENGDAVATYFALIGLRSDVLLRVEKEREKSCFGGLQMSRYVCFFTCVRLCPSSQERRHSLSRLRELFFKSSPSLCKLSHWHLSAVSWSSSVWQGESLRKPNSILIGQRLFSRRRLRSINASLGLSLFSAATSSHLSI